jgi:hypothetical protein
MPVRPSSVPRAWLTLGLVLGAMPAGAAEPTKAQCIASNESAQDLRGSGKLLEARTQLALCVAATCPGAVRQDCAQRLADLDKALPSLVLVAKDSAGNDLGAVHATIDDKPLADVLNGTAIALNPGEHHVVLEAAGLPKVEKTLVLHEGEKGRREVVAFAAAPPAVAPASADAVPSSGPPDAQVDRASSAGPGDTQRKVAVVLGGVGALGLVVGGILGIVAKSTYDHAMSSECGGVYGSKTSCGAQGVSDVQSANTQATVSTVAFIAGGALLGGGAYLYLSAKRGGDVAVGPTIGPRGAGLGVRGAW